MLFRSVSQSRYAGEGRDFWNQPRINRQMYMISDGTMIASRIYPNPSDTKLQTQFRETVQEILALCNKLDNYWDTYDSATSKAQEYYTTKSNTMHYPDYVYSKYNGKLSLLRSGKHTKLTIGATALSIATGDILENNGDLVGKYVFCADCGKKINRSSALRTNDGKYYCNHCATFCTECDHVIILSDKDSYVDYHGRLYCKSCFERFFKTCVCCGELIPKSQLFTVTGATGEYVCPTCLKNDRKSKKHSFLRCGSCGNVFRSENTFVRIVTRYDNRHFPVCRSCEDGMFSSVYSVEVEE